MALKPCRECGQPISTSAAACPHCGKKQKRQGGSNLLAGLLVIGLFVIIGGLFGEKSSKPGSEPAAADPPVSQPEEEVQTPSSSTDTDQSLLKQMTERVLPDPSKDGTYPLKTDVLACTTEGQISKIIDLFSSGDEEAGRSEAIERLTTGECTMIKAGTSIFLKVHMLSDAYEIRPRGSSDYMWAPKKMTLKSLRG